MCSRLDGKTEKVEVAKLSDVEFAFRFNQTQMAKALGVNRGTLRKMIAGNVNVMVVVKRDDDGEICGLEAFSGYGSKK